MIAQRPVPILFRGMNYMRRATHTSNMSTEPAAQRLKCIFEDYRQQKYVHWYLHVRVQVLVGNLGNMALIFLIVVGIIF